jgi:hypothetical protein
MFCIDVSIIMSKSKLTPIRQNNEENYYTKCTLSLVGAHRYCSLNSVDTLIFNIDGGAFNNPLEYLIVPIIWTTYTLYIYIYIFIQVLLYKTRWREWLNGFSRSLNLEIFNRIYIILWLFEKFKISIKTKKLSDKASMFRKEKLYESGELFVVLLYCTTCI